MRSITTVCLILTLHLYSQAETDSHVTFSLNNESISVDNSRSVTEHSTNDFNFDTKLRRARWATNLGPVLYVGGPLVCFAGMIIVGNSTHPEKISILKGIAITGFTIYAAGPVVSGLGAQGVRRLLADAEIDAPRPGVWGLYAAGLAIKLATVYSPPPRFGKLAAIWFAADVLWISSLVRSSRYARTALYNAKYSNLRVDLVPTFSRNGDIGAHLVASF
ncbi:hypothetical protein QA601_01810 [Chitinispirillales bacterium ANBcel5]|uniref:hypothetical protein n=1 Tax=Cellulosispirillum alkaliphilum TaxID=3039283 RepID=UPI002A536B04|nr:hypothetical protein [Chitinispirillales bacterium ANBcel5]